MAKAVGTRTQLFEAESLIIKYRDERYLQVAEKAAPEDFTMRRYYLTKNGHAEFYYNNKTFIVTDLVGDGDISLELEHQGRKVEVDFSKSKASTPASAPTDGKVRHAKYAQIKMCIDNDIPVYLVGEAGTGKNYTLQDRRLLQTWG